MRYSKTIDVPCSAAAAFAYVSDFSRVSEWDPGVVESRALGDAVGYPIEFIDRPAIVRQFGDAAPARLTYADDAEAYPRLVQGILADALQRCGLSMPSRA